MTAVGPHPHVPTPSDVESFEFVDAVIVPGLVNVHTHLELTHLVGRNDEVEFPRWLRRVRELKDATTPDDLASAAERGLRECWAAGVTTVADTGSTGAVALGIARLGGRGIVYQEVFGPDPASCDQSLAELGHALGHLRPLASERLRIGVSPHAPYTVSAPLYRAVADLARRERLPVAVHLAESPEETQLIRDGAGPFADALRARGIAVEPHHCSPVQFLVQRGVLASGVLCIHCVQVDDADIRSLREAGAVVAHCPLSNRAHRHGTAPLAAFRAAGVPVGLGTDSVVSVGSIDLWAEAAAAGLTGGDALRQLTLDNARALGWETEIGSLDVGKWADLAVFAQPVPARPGPSPPALLTVIAGRTVHRSEAGSSGGQ